MDIINRMSVEQDKEPFNKNIYSKFDLLEIIRLKKNNVDKFIYFLLDDEELVYIGMSSGNLLGRLNAHISNKTFNSVYYKSVLTDESLSRIEKQLITKYRPKLNKTNIFNEAKYSVFDLKTEATITDTKENLVGLLNTNMRSLENLLNESSKKLYKRYVLLKNKPIESSFKYVLDTHTGLVEKHNYITFAEKVGKKQSSVWYFINGINKSFMKKRYVLTNELKNEKHNKLLY
jgi:hypothetical protein